MTQSNITQPLWAGGLVFELYIIGWIRLEISQGDWVGLNNTQNQSLHTPTISNKKMSSLYYCNL